MFLLPSEWLLFFFLFLSHKEVFEILCEPHFLLGIQRYTFPKKYYSPSGKKALKKLYGRIGI